MCGKEKSKNNTQGRIYKKRSSYFLIAIILLSLGCCSVKHYPLPVEYRPLESIIERPSIPGIKDDVVCVIGPHVYVTDLGKWLEDNRPGSQEFFDCLNHEMVHSRRQSRMGLPLWLFYYISDKNFRLREEQFGYYISIKRKLDRGEKVDAANYARAMSEYYYGMISYEKAEEWVMLVIEGKWEAAPHEIK